MGRSYKSSNSFVWSRLRYEQVLKGDVGWYYPNETKYFTFSKGVSSCILCFIKYHCFQLWYIFDSKLRANNIYSAVKFCYLFVKVMFDVTVFPAIVDSFVTCYI